MSDASCKRYGRRRVGTNRMINPLDEGGVAIAAIQALHRRVVQLEAEVARLQASAEPPQHRSD